MPSHRTASRPRAPHERLIFALDVDHADAAERLVRILAPHVGMFKVGVQLFAAAGPMILDLIHGHGAGVFLDLKLHDIPEVVAAAAREAGRQGARLLTVHALGGSEMIRRAVRELSQMTLVPGLPAPACLAVTLLTSHGPEVLAEVGIDGSVDDAARRLALLAMRAGAAGVVCSAREARAIRDALGPEAVLVTPGIRGPKDPAGDQRRVLSAREAIANGADYVVVGRPIRDARDPAAAARRVVEEIAAAGGR